ncbi:MAG: hypothetical protein KKC76_15070 [Proteobacteria bacterium]|nr:hypothetical protein [Pseudomonadota bacterium]MBU4294257.1 hypothetical protein [Pseudomonadota bacterium]MCG2748770.1 hypothetical protein [Desulfobulbaceae bacterium]
MRCPKCGYISFDQEETCAKCDASLTEISRSLAGTAVRVHEPFFLASILGQAGEHGADEEVKFDLSVAESGSESDVEIEFIEDEEGIPRVDLSPFERHEEIVVEEESGISFDLPGEEAEEAQAVAAAVEEEGPGVQGTIDFAFGEELMQVEEPPPAAQDATGLNLTLEEAGGEEALEELGGSVFELEEEPEAAALEAEESLPELELEMNGVAEESLELDAGIQPDLAEEPAADETTATKGSGLDLDIDVNLDEDEPSEEEMVFNLEDIDMSDLVIDESGGAEGEADRPEDTTLDLEDFLSGGQVSDAGAPMDLTMEDIDLRGEEQDKQDKKSDELPDIEL